MSDQCTCTKAGLLHHTRVRTVLPAGAHNPSKVPGLLHHTRVALQYHTDAVKPGRPLLTGQHERQCNATTLMLANQAGL